MRDYGPAASERCPVVCLPGLARTAEDFDRLALRLASQGRRVAALDYRGRGLSDRDPDWRNYNIKIEGEDIQAVLTAAGIAQAVFVGTSRGGLHIMALAAQRPALIRAAVLNDIGPVIEPAGLARIRAYVGKLPEPTSWSQAVALFKHVFADQFPALEADDWDAYAHLTLEEKQGVLVPRYDARLLLTVQNLDLAAPPPALWAQFDALAGVALLAIRGANSDLLSPATLAAMAERHPRCETHIVPGQGHAPLLLDEATLSRIAKFVETADPAFPAPPR